MGMFAQKVATAAPNDSSGLNFEEGHYPLVQLDQFKLFASKKPGREGVEMVAIVCDVLESRVATRPAGTRGVGQILNSLHPGAADDAKRFINALFNTPEEARAWIQALLGTGAAVGDGDVAEVLSLEGLASPAQPCRGRLLSLECYVKKSTKTGKEFTKHIWRPVTAAVQAEAAALRAKAGLPPLA